MIEVKDLRKRFGPVEAVRGVDLWVDSGECFGLIDPNGAGKTTTLKTLATLVKPDAGVVRVDGIDALADPIAARRTLGVLPHAPGLYPRLSARENIRYFAELRGLSDTELDAAVERQIAELGIGGFADRAAKGLSHGQATRVALARAIVHSPGNVVLDEPVIEIEPLRLGEHGFAVFQGFVLGLLRLL